MSIQDLQAAKEQVRQATDIVDLVGGYLTLHRQGRGYVGLCPWHDDSRPSLQVNPDRQSFKCWVCDVGGDVFSFLMQMENVEFREALEMLADRAGIALKASSGGDASSPFDRRNLLKAAAWAEAQYHNCLVKASVAEPARRYLQERGINDESIRRFALGFAPLEWDWLLGRGTAEGIAPEALERIDCVVRRDRGGFYDRFRGRLVFSIRDVRGRPIAFGGRVLPELARPDDAKYINSRETVLFNKSSNLYGLDLARDGIARERGVVIMEGYTDVVMAHQHGINQAVAVLGTALGERHIPLLQRYTDSITLVLDGDAAGKGRTLDILDNLLALFIAHEVKLKILTLPEGADPCDVISSQGRDAFSRLLAQATDALTHKIQAVTNGLAPAADPHQAAQAVESILATLARALPGAPSAASTAFVREQQTLVRVGRLFGVQEDGLRRRLAALRNAQKPTLRSPRAAAADAPAKPATARLTPWEREFFELVMHHPQSHDELLQAVGEVDFSSSSATALFGLVREFLDRGETPSFTAMMTATDQPELKNLLVDCDQEGQEKSESDLRQRIDGLLTTLAARQLEPLHQSLMARLQTQHMDPSHEDETLLAYFKELKSRQAPVPPTDG